MATTLDHLLPGPDVAVRCADHARTIAVDPGGTAIRADRIVLVDTPSPWPKPALAHPLLAELSTVLQSGPVPTRLLAASGLRFGSNAAAGPEAAPGIAVVVYRRQGGAAAEQQFRVGDAEDLVAWGRALTDDDDLSPWAESAAGPARPAVLICTQGSHDVCCGSDGVRFAAEVEASLDVDVYRVSHTGGHRFAPTALTLPDGRMWADLDLDALRAILAEVGDVDAVIDRCRGWWGADTGAAQVAERAVLAELGWDLNPDDRSVSITEITDVTEPEAPARAGVGPTAAAPSPTAEAGLVAGSGRAPLIEAMVTGEQSSWLVELAPGRIVPTIACRQPGGLPAKQAQEYEVLAVRRL